MRTIVESRTLTVRAGNGQRFFLGIARQLIELSGRESAGVEKVELLLYNVKRLIDLSSVERLGPQAGVRNQVVLFR
jgi:hypothetical protein